LDIAQISAAKETNMMKMGRSMVVGVALLAALASSGVAADGSRTGSLDCDHACKIEIITGKQDGFAVYQNVSYVLFATDTYVSSGPGEIGFTR